MSQAESGTPAVSITEMEEHRPHPKKLGNSEYVAQLNDLQIELVKLQRHVIDQGQRVVLLFEGRDAAGKGGAIKRFTEHLNPRPRARSRLPKPTDTERGQWYFQRYTQNLPTSGEIVLFDRSWYNRAGVERVMGFCTEAVRRLPPTGPRLEQALVESGISFSSCGSRCHARRRPAASRRARPTRSRSGSSPRWSESQARRRRVLRGPRRDAGARRHGGRPVDGGELQREEARAAGVRPIGAPPAGLRAQGPGGRTRPRSVRRPVRGRGHGIVADHVSPYVRRPRTDGPALGIAVLVVATTAAIAHGGTVSAPEAWVFHRINDLPDAPSGRCGCCSSPGCCSRRWSRCWSRCGSGAGDSRRRSRSLVPLKLLVERALIKQLVDRRRPATSICDRDLSCLHLRGDVPIGTPSFPSGHAVIVWGIVWLVLPYLPRRWMRGTAIGIGVGVMVARVYLGAHNPLDVVCGAALGVVVGAGLNLAFGVPGPDAADAAGTDARAGVSP